MSLTPCEVVYFLDNSIGELVDHRLVEPWKARVPYHLAPEVRIFMGMVRMIPPESMLMTGESYCEFVGSIFLVEAFLEHWRAGGRDSLGMVPGIGLLHPIELIRRALIDGDEGAKAEATERARLEEVMRGRSPAVMPPLLQGALLTASQLELHWAPTIHSMSSAGGAGRRYPQNIRVGRIPNRRQPFRVWAAFVAKGIDRLGAPAVETTEPAATPKSRKRSKPSHPTNPAARKS